MYLEHKKIAREFSEEGKWRDAGEHYLAAAYAALAQFKKPEKGGGLSPEKLGHFGRYCFLGGLCHRLDGNDARVELVSQQGILVAREVRDHVPRFRRPSPDAPLGYCHELEGDLQLLRRRGDHRDAYEAALERYEAVENPRQWSCEPEFHTLAKTLLDLADAAGEPLDEETAARLRDLSLTGRVEYKLDNFADIIEAAVEAERIVPASE